MSDHEFFDLDPIIDNIDISDIIGKNPENNISKGKQDFLGDPLEFRKERKRRQNRESALRSRSRKKELLIQAGEERKSLEDLQARLNAENAKLKAENKRIQKEIQIYKNMLME